MRSFKGINFGTLLSNPKEAEELLPDLKVGGLSSSGYTWLLKMSCFVFVLFKGQVNRRSSPEQPHF